MHPAAAFIPVLSPSAALHADAAMVRWGGLQWHMGFFNESYIPSGRGFAETFGFLCAIHDVNHWNQVRCNAWRRPRARARACARVCV